MRVEKNRKIRPEIQDKINKALAKKPTASFLNSRGYTPEQINQRYGMPPIKKTKNGRSRVGPIKRIAPPVPTYAFQRPSYEELQTPNWFKTSGDVDVSIIVPMFNSKEQIKEQIAKWDVNDDGLKKEIIYVDDACPQRSYEQVISSWNEKKSTWNYPIGRIIINDKNGGFAFSCNTGARFASGKYLIFLNADCVVTPNWLKPMIDLMQSDSEIGIVGNLQLRKNSTIVESAGSEWRNGSFEHIGRSTYQSNRLSEPFKLENMPSDLKEPSERQMVTGSCLLIEKNLFNQVDGFNTEYRIGYWEDADLCMKIKSIGCKIFYQPKSMIYHTPGHAQSGHNVHVDYNKQYFYRNWITTGVMNRLLFGAKKTKIKGDEKAVIFTAITSGYDDLQDTQNNKGNVDLVAFLENTQNSRTWEVKPIEIKFSEPNRNAKMYKILSHKYFPDYEYSLWLDGNVRLLQPIHSLIQSFLQDIDLVVFKHPERSCIYAEGSTCVARNLDNEAVIKKQLKTYEQAGFPPNAGLSECTVILRRHCPQVAKFNEMWWEEICNGSKRDQISFPYIAKATGLKYAFFPGNLRDVSNFIFQKLGSHKRR